MNLPVKLLSEYATLPTRPHSADAGLHASAPAS